MLSRLRDTITNGTAGNCSKCSNNNRLDTTPVSSNPRRKNPAAAASSSRDLGEIGKLWAVTERLKEEAERLAEKVERLEKIEESTAGRRRSPRKTRDVGILTGMLVEQNQLLHERTEEIERLKAKVTEQDRLLQERNEHIEKQNGDIGRLEAEIARIGHRSEENTPTRDRKSSNDHRTTRSKDYHSNMKEELLHTLSPSGSKTDTISVADVVELVRMLNALIEQASSLTADSLSYRESPISTKELGDVLNELTDYIAPQLCNELRNKANDFNIEPDPLITQITLQSTLTTACIYIIDNGVPLSSGAALSRGHGDMTEAGQADADTRKAQPHTYASTSQSESREINRKYLKEIVLKMITGLGCSLESREVLSPHTNEALEEIVRASLGLHKVLNEDLTSTMELVTYTISSDTPFDSSLMEDTDGDASESGSGRVICTLEAGLQCRKRKERGSEEEWCVVTKAKVVLANTLEAYRKGRK